MNEEEIIHCLKELIEYGQETINDMEYVRPVDITIHQHDIDAIKGLLDLYNKEKEKNNALMRDEYDKWASEEIQEYHDLSSELNQKCIHLEYELQQEKEKNKKLEEEKKQAFKDYNSTACELMDVINLMAENLKKNVDVLYDTNKDIQDIKRYYFNKVKEIKNE